eukprot:jgi/Mesen1/2289/ME000154S01460
MWRAVGKEAKGEGGDLKEVAESGGINRHGAALGGGEGAREGPRTAERVPGVKQRVVIAFPVVSESELLKLSQRSGAVPLPEGAQQHEQEREREGELGSVAEEKGGKKGEFKSAGGLWSEKDQVTGKEEEEEAEEAKKASEVERERGSEREREGERKGDWEGEENGEEGGKGKKGQLEGREGDSKQGAGSPSPRQEFGQHHSGEADADELPLHSEHTPGRCMPVWRARRGPPFEKPSRKALPPGSPSLAKPASNPKDDSSAFEKEKRQPIGGFCDARPV